TGAAERPRSDRDANATGPRSGSVLNGWPGGREEVSDRPQSASAMTSRQTTTTVDPETVPTTASDASADAAPPPKRTHLVERTSGSNPPVTIKVPPVTVPLAKLPPVEVPEV